jgi:chemotaxis protein methyltransferase WspC
LIYLHADARSRVMASIRELMADSGLLVVGHAEAAIARQHGFAAVGDPGAFAFVSSTVPKKSRATPDASRGSALGHEAVRAAVLPASGTARQKERTPTAARPPEVDVTLEQIRQLGDEGRTEEAILACREYVRRVPDSADAYFLLGVLCGALGQDDAATTAFRRALYLEPDHQAALLHLALAHDAGGDVTSAARLRARASRTQTAPGKGGR